MKKRYILLLALLIGTTTAGCKVENKTKYGDTYIYELLSDDEVAIGDLQRGNRKSTYFVPEILDGYKVTQLGYPSGLVSTGNGTFSQDGSSEHVNRFYYPSTIKSINENYLIYANKTLEVMYCGATLDLAKLSVDDDLIIYVPYQDYESYFDIFSGDKKNLKKANITYDLNYDGRLYYYVDYVDANEKIENIPPIPTRDGYSFLGWYSDESFSHLWNFTSDLFFDEVNELHLYAKWDKN